MRIRHEVISPCVGIVVSIFPTIDSPVKEGEEVIAVQTPEGIVSIVAEVNGKMIGIEVKAGDEVIPGMIVAYIEESSVRNHG